MDKSNCSLDQILLTEAETVTAVSHEGTSNCKQSINKPVGEREALGERTRRNSFFFPASPQLIFPKYSSTVKVSA